MVSGHWQVYALMYNCENCSIPGISAGDDNDDNSDTDDNYHKSNDRHDDYQCCIYK